MRKKKGSSRKKKNKVVISWNPTEMTDLNQFKKLLVAHEIHSPCVRQILNNWATENRIILKDWK